MITPTATPPAHHRRVYRNPPVEEAICQLRFSQPLRWTVTTPGELYARLREFYPAEPQQQAMVQANIGVEAGQTAEPNAPRFEFTSGTPRILYSNEDGTRKVGVGPDSVSVHGMRPYEGWESLHARLSQAVEILAEGREVPSIQAVGLRYINRLSIPETRFEVGEYLTIDIDLPSAFPANIGAFFHRVECTYDDSPIHLAFTFASLQAPESESEFLLDLDYTLVRTAAVPVSSALDILQNLKDREGQTFESLLKDKARELFDRD